MISKENDNRCILYCRVSSKEQEDRGYSLEAQEKLLTDYAERNGLAISKIFKISESASGRQIRKTFNEMLAYIKKRKIDIILCEKIDRLTRNLKDAAVVSDWVNGSEAREVHFVKENFTVSRNTRAHENLVWDMKVAIARFYTNNLSEEVKKGQKAKIEDGWIPNGLKFGYKTIGEKGRKTHVIDEKYAPHIRRMFELYNSGEHSTLEIADMLFTEGLRTKTGKKVPKSAIHRILADPFYCGRILWKGAEYDGKHEGIVSEDLFYQVQEKMKRRFTAGKIKKHNHVLKGMMTCSNCGCLVSWEVQKGHVYGRCKGFKPCERKGYVRQDDIEKQLDDMLAKIQPRDQEVLDWINEALKEKNQDKTDYSMTSQKQLNEAIERLEGRLDKMYEDRLDGVITDEYYKRKADDYKREKRSILKQLENLEDRVDNYYEIGLEIHRLAFNARDDYYSEETSPEEKRLLLSRFFSHMELTLEREVHVTATPAYQFLAEWMPKLNATSELLKNGSEYKKTGTLVPAHPCLLPRLDSNQEPPR